MARYKTSDSISPSSTIMSSSTGVDTRLSPALADRLLLDVHVEIDVEDQAADKEVATRTCEETIFQEIGKLVQMAFPVVCTSILEYTPDVTLIVLVGHIESPRSSHYVDAAALSAMFTNMTAMYVAFGLSTALDTLCAQACGAGKPQKLGIYLQTGMLVIGLSMLPVFALNWFCGDILRWCGQNAEVAQLAGEFSWICVLGIPFFSLYEMNSKLLLAQNNTTPPMVIAMVGVVVAIVSGYLLTFKTSLGFHGAAIGFTLNNVTMAFGCLVYYAYSNNHKEWWCGWDLVQAKQQIKPFLRLGVPGMLGMILEFWAFEIMACMAGLLPNSVVDLSAHAVLVQLMYFLSMAYYGMSVAGSIHVGHALGANNPVKARRMSRLTLTLVGVLALALAGIVLLLRPLIPRAFIRDPVAIQRASKCLLVVTPYVAISGLNYAAQGIFRGIGKQNFGAMVNFVAFNVVGLPLAALLVYQYHINLEGLWIGFETGAFVAIVSCLVILLTSCWETLAQEAQARMER